MLMSDACALLAGACGNRTHPGPYQGPATGFEARGGPPEPIRSRFDLDAASP